MSGGAEDCLSRNGDDQQNGQDPREGELQGFTGFEATGVGAVIDAAGVLGEDGDVELEVIEALIATKPDAGAGGGDHE